MSGCPIRKFLNLILTCFDFQCEGLHDGCAVYLFRIHDPSAYFSSVAAIAALAPLDGNNTPVSGSVHNQGFGGHDSAPLSPHLDGIALGDICTCTGARARTHTHTL